MTEDGVFDALVTHDDGATSWSSCEAATTAFYGDCSREDARWAFEWLRRQNSASLWQEPYPLVDVPPTARVSIVGTRMGE